MSEEAVEILPVQDHRHGGKLARQACQIHNLVHRMVFEQFTEVVRQLGDYWLLLNQAPPAGR